MQISFVMVIFLLISDQISGTAKVSEGGILPQRGGRPLPLWKKARPVWAMNPELPRFRGTLTVRLTENGKVRVHAGQGLKMTAQTAMAKLNFFVMIL